MSIFFEPYKGHISINHQDIKNIDKKVLRRHINYLPQQAYIFNGSILENLTLGGNNIISQEDILKACELAEIRQDIERMPMGYKLSSLMELVYQEDRSNESPSLVLF